MDHGEGAMFTKAIARRPGRSVAEGITAHPELGKPDYETALRQHDAYVAALERCGLSVEVLPALEEFPDSCFVEDVAVCAPGLAVVTAPGARSRAGETEGVAEVLSRHYARVERIEAPGTLEGGDVMMVGKIFYVGLSARTNRAGFSRFAAQISRNISQPAPGRSALRSPQHHSGLYASPASANSFAKRSGGTSVPHGTTTCPNTATRRQPSSRRRRNPSRRRRT